MKEILKTNLMVQDTKKSRLGSDFEQSVSVMILKRLQFHVPYSKNIFCKAKKPLLLTLQV
jgi:hypothetical protein